MLATNYTTFRKNLKSYCDKAVDDSDIVVVTRKNERNVVIMSVETYDCFMKELR